MKKTTATAAIAALILTTTAALAAPTTADKCEATKNKTVGSYYACREKAEATAITKGLPADYSKCTAKFDDKWDSAETKGEMMCPDNVLTAPMNAYVAAQATAAAAILAGTTNIPTCGDAVVNVAGEQCDGADLSSASCATLGHLAGALACTGSCKYDVSACSDCPGFAFGGACFILGVDGASCDTACAAAGLVYDTATQTVAGSGGTAANCEALLDGLGAPGSGLDFPFADCTLAGLDPLGCLEESGTRAHCVFPATTSTGSFGDVSRVCACQ